MSADQTGEDAEVDSVECAVPSTDWLCSNPGPAPHNCSNNSEVESVSFPAGFLHFLSLLPQTVHPPFLPPTKVTTQQALINFIFFFFFF